jgi:DNA-binding beta-propeller fold protein YncE
MKFVRRRLWLLMSILTAFLWVVPLESSALVIGGGGGDLIIKPGPMQSPMRIAAVSSDVLIATDYQARKIYRFSPTAPDQPIVMFETKGHPLSIEAVGNYLVVGNDSTGTIEVYRPNGYKVKTFVANGPIQASDIAYDRQRRLVFVADSLNREIKVFDQLGSKQLRSFGTAGPLHDPKGISIDPATMQVFVTDYGDPAVGIAASLQVYTYQGQLLRRVTGSFSRPQGIAVKPGRIFMVDAMLGKVLIFDRGTYVQIATLGSYGVNEGELLLPMDVYFDSRTGRLLVTNNRQGKVSIFNANGL